ncbi:hypothetical protein LTR37_004355 [Vermiconidia calcicola]|uniref:Uncharacterized protein n=1 Tax=Vermiconidia calcicola TaxID=1690605 RepID=A0ACC3NMD1_9PEZI|nr:hypothetical protein LTR37_004355 [Vermiconidia calcicola]
MWLLTCEGNLFENKRIWLRPGSTHLLGRTTGRSEAGERIQYIDHKSVSRKHLTIEIAPTQSGDSSKLHVRSNIKLKDGSKTGTTLNGEKFSQETRLLGEKKYTFKLGHYEHLFHLWWHPVTLSFTSSSKKAKGDPIAALREKLDQTDIKLITEYVTNETTHAIAKKRNTPPTLQALLQARWVVTDGFADALATAVVRGGPNGTSALEEGFDSNWPDEKVFIVPAASEPNPRPNEFLKPNQERAEVFQDFIFIFLSQGQYDTLLPVLTSGGGKALLWEWHLGESKVVDLVDYVKEVAGHKGSKQFQLSQQSGRGGVVAVRLNDGSDAWRVFSRALDLALDQRSIEQNEFLDAILTMDASGLQTQLRESPESSMPNAGTGTAASRPQRQAVERTQRAATVPDSPSPAPRPPASAQPVTEEPQPDQQAEQTSTAARRRQRRIITQSRFKGFDDFDPSQFSKPASQSPEPWSDNRGASQAPSVQGMDIDEQEPPQAPRTQQNSRKRPAPTQEEEEEAMYANVATAHTALKRQKTAAALDGGTGSKSSGGPEQDATPKVPKPKKKAKEMDVMAEVQARKQKEEEKRQQDEEYLREALQGIDISKMKDLAKVEEMAVPTRERPMRRANDDGRSERWDPAWNGRKNFKAFRPQGQRGDGPRLQRVIVPLEEVPRKGHGIGDEYWLNTSTSTSKSKSKSQSQSQSQSVRQGASRSQRAGGGGGDDDEDTARFRRRIQSSRQEDEENAAADEVLPEEIAGHARDQELEAAANSTPSQTFGTESQRKAAGKRPAAQQGSGAPPAKKSRQSRLAAPTQREVVNVDDDDDDALKFRRRKR